MTKEARLKTFVEWWQTYGKGDEKGEAQIFLDRLFRAFGHEGVQEAGGILEERVKRRRHEKETIAFADLVVPNIVLIEMKKRGENLRKHYQQVFEYWINLVPNRPKYVVLCNFDEFWVYNLNHQLDEPLDHVKVEELPQRWGALAFLYPPSSPDHRRVTFGNDLVAVTEEAAQGLSLLFKELSKKERKYPHAQRFILQCMLALFAEDIQLLPQYTFTQVIEDCLQGQNSYDLITLLFHSMNYPELSQFGRFKGVDYFDGGIFSQIHPVQLTHNELQLLRDAARLDWSKIRPAIFGTLFEKSMNTDERHQTGAHFTSEADIQRIIQPVIVYPWRDRIHQATSVAQLRTLQTELCHYQVLDPACGSGNFLYIAYRELKRLEKEILDRIAQLDKPNGDQFEIGLVNAKQFWGLDVNPFAVELAKVTLMIAKKLAVDELYLHEKPLPLDNLDANIRAADALLEPWPPFDACIGNPPYMGAKRLKQEHKPAYINQIRDLFPEVPGNADYCIYWFRKAHDLMREGTRVGFVGTNTIRQNYSRIGGLDYIVDHEGHIFEAVSSMPWSGEAKVHVSIACWTKGSSAPSSARLWVNQGQDMLEVHRINSSLSYKTDVRDAKELRVNKDPKRVFQGQTPGHDGFVISADKAHELVKSDLFSRDVIFPYMTGDDLLGNPRSQPARYIIDFEDRDIVDARSFKSAYQHIEKTVLTERKAKAEAQEKENKLLLKQNPQASVNQDHIHALNQWWLHFRGRSDFKAKIQPMTRCIICSRHTKRPIFEFVSPKIVIGDSLQAFLFEDDYSFGILQSYLHWEWFTEKGSTLKADFRYTPSSVFDTFPWPQNPTPAQVKAVADAAQKLLAYRYGIIQKLERGITLRDLYTSLELPGKNPLKDLHADLNKSVIAAYGFDPHQDVLKQLLDLNLALHAAIEAEKPVTSPGIPSTYPTPQDLISQWFIRPPEWI